MPSYPLFCYALVGVCCLLGFVVRCLVFGVCYCLFCAQRVLCRLLLFSVLFVECNGFGRGGNGSVFFYLLCIVCWLLFSVRGLSCVVCLVVVRVCWCLLVCCCMFFVYSFCLLFLWGQFVVCCSAFAM